MTKKTWAQFQQDCITNVGYVLLNSPNKTEDFAIYPFDSEMNMLPQSPGLHYAQSSFDGGSIILGWKNRKINSADIVLANPRYARILYSASMWLLPGKKFSKKFTTNFSQGIEQLAQLKVASLSVAVGKNSSANLPSRIYIRPAVMRVGKFGVAPTKDDKLHFSCIMWEWGPYLPDDAYAKGARALVFTNVARTQPILGKHSGNYASFGPIGSFARKHNFHEAIIPGPYLYDSTSKTKSYINPGSNLARNLDQLVLADGPGEDLIFVSPKGEVFKQPADANILQGTTRAYITTYLAPKLKMKVSERIITAGDIKREKLVPIFCGNAVKACKVREIAFTDGKKVLPGSIKITQNTWANKMAKRFHDELNRKVPMSHKSLLTPVDLKAGQKIYETIK